jgi:hypothetical protein
VHVADYTIIGFAYQDIHNVSLVDARPKVLHHESIDQCAFHAVPDHIDAVIFHDVDHFHTVDTDEQLERDEDGTCVYVVYVV